MLGGPLGAALGAAFGHNFDKGMSSLGKVGFTGDIQRIQTAFFTATFSVMGHLAKSDGQVSRAEIHIAEDLMSQMRLNASQKQVAQRLFNEGKKKGFPLDDALMQFRQECHRRKLLLQMFMEIQVAVALSDGELQKSELQILQHCASRLGFTGVEFQGILQRIQAQVHSQAQPRTQQGMPLEDAYKLLGITSSASEQDVKKAYRRQMNQHHPDKLVSKGLPEEMMELANKKVHDIKQAYETIRASRKK